MESMTLGAHRGAVQQSRAFPFPPPPLSPLLPPEPERSKGEDFRNDAAQAGGRVSPQLFFSPPLFPPPPLRHLRLLRRRMSLMRRRRRLSCTCATQGLSDAAFLFLPFPRDVTHSGPGLTCFFFLFFPSSTCTKRGLERRWPRPYIPPSPSRGKPCRGHSDF